MFRAKIIVAARITPRDRDKVQQQHRLKGNNFSTIEWITVITAMDFSSKRRMAKSFISVLSSVIIIILAITSNPGLKNQQNQ